MDSYRKLFAIPGTIGFSAAALLGRLPAGMVGLAIILPISALMGSYAIAGAVAAFTMMGMGLSAPFNGRLVDKYGQSRILYVFAFLNLLSTLALIVCIYLETHLLLLCIVGAIAGASRISTGSLARARWAYVLQSFSSENRKKTLQSAYAFEAVMDEVVFISAPILATLLCTSVHPLAGLLCCLASFVIGALALAMQHGTEPAVIFSRKRHKSAFSIRGLQIIFAAVLFIGISAGAVEVIVVARATDVGARQLAGFLIAILAFSSILAGFWYGACTFKLSAYTLWLRCLGLLVLGLVPFIFATNLFILALAMFIAGLSIAPSSISGQVLTEHILPVKLLNEGMSIVVTAMIFGMAIGGWIAGILIDKWGVFQAGILPALVTFIAFITALVFSRSLQ